jgi:hypothetical protein
MIVKSYRQLFLEEFLKLYGVKKVIYAGIANDKIFGIAIYDLDDSDEIQDFCWHMTDENAPCENVLEIIKVITENNWCEIDQITISEDELFNKMNWTDRNLFDKSFAEIFEVNIRMVDNGEETDTFFVHM